MKCTAVQAIQQALFDPCLPMTCQLRMMPLLYCHLHVNMTYQGCCIALPAYCDFALFVIGSGLYIVPHAQTAEPVAAVTNMCAQMLML